MSRTRPAAKAAQLDLLREGEATVEVVRPFAGLPDDLVVVWRSRNDRQTFIPEYRPKQACRVAYRVWADPVQLRDLERRAAANKSGSAVRGWATARAGHPAQLNMTDPRYLQLVRVAANTTTLRTTEGPVRCRVQLLDQLEPFVPRCQLCHASLGEHTREETTRPGDWRTAQDGKHRDWDPNLSHIVVSYLCPEAAGGQ